MRCRAGRALRAWGSLQHRGVERGHVAGDEDERRALLFAERREAREGAVETSAIEDAFERVARVREQALFAADEDEALEPRIAADAQGAIEQRFSWGFRGQVALGRAAHPAAFAAGEDGQRAGAFCC
jgi:hypothetical protein